MGLHHRPDIELSQDVDLGELWESLGFLLRISQVRVFEHFFSNLGRCNFRPGEFSILWTIHRNPRIKQGLLGQTLRIKPARMTKAIRKLEEQGLLVREIPNHDRRSVLLSLTPAGEDFVNANRESFFALDADLTRSMKEKEVADIVRLLKRFNS